jgi:ABC-type Fe3+/spermidine/putrescine transport system ATPase subunit
MAPQPDQNATTPSSPSSSEAPPKLGARQLTKAFGPVTVLQDVDVDFFAGEIHAVVGENGAGKSTLMRILSGILEPTAGEVWFDGRSVGTGDLRAMEKLGVRLIHQELNLAEDLSVVENLFLGQEPLSEPGIQDLYVAGDNPGMGKIAAEYFIKKLGGKGNIVVLRGLPTVIDNQRFDTFMEKIKGTDIKVLDSKYANWNRDDGFKMMQDFLTRFPHIDGVWAQDDDIALGVLDALRQAKREREMFVVGGAGMKEMVKRVMDKDTLTPVDIIYSPSMIATAIELTAVHFVAKLPVNGNYILDSPLITPENAAQYYFPSSPF